MAVLNVNPTRMECARLKKKLAAATRGHKLLKDKLDELVRQFFDIIKDCILLREKVEKGISDANKSLTVSRSVMGKEEISAALLIPKQEINLKVSEKSIMSVKIPAFEAETKTNNPYDIFSYGYGFTDLSLDEGILKLSKLLPDILKLAEKENAVRILASEIEKNRRRVNALEHIVIPDCKDTVKYIMMKLSENERANQVRLMKAGIK